MPANSPYPGESQEQFAMRQKSMNPMAGEAPGSYGQPQDDGGGEAGVRQAIAQRFPDALPDKLDEVYQAWQEHSHWAQRQGQEADLEQFFQQYEADAQGFGGREAVNPELADGIKDRIRAAQPQDWDGKIYEEMGEGQSPRVVAEGLAADPEDPTPRMGSFPPIKAKRKKTFYLPPLKRYQ